MAKKSVVRLSKIGLCLVTLCMVTFMFTTQTNSVRKFSIENTVQYLYTEDRRADRSIKVEMSKNAKDLSKPAPKEKKIPLIYIVTPSGQRLTQKADLTRMSYTLRLVPRVHWILVEDNVNKTVMVARLLKRSGLPYTHLNVPTPSELVILNNMSRISKPRGLSQRNAGIQWMRQHGRPPAVVYFADDDNVYDTRLFEEMRYTKNVSIWPTAFTTNQRYQSPIVKNGKVTGWLSSFPRNFCTDMAGFAINLKMFLDHRNVTFRNRRGRMETDLLSQFKLKLADLEPKADNCTKILVWHTRTEIPPLEKENKVLKQFGRNTYRDLEI